MLTQEFVIDLFSYEEGKLLWKKKTGKSVVIGKEAGFLDRHGYRRVRLNNKYEGVHRIIFLMFHVYLPQIIDHVDRDVSNNKIENLRGCTKSQNEMNRSKYSCNKTGHKNIHKNKRNKFVVEFKIKGKERFQKEFDSLEEAVKVAIQKRNELHGAFACHE
jgi:hypothetical protein